MLNIKKAQEAIIQNKINHNFNTKDLDMEFCLAYGELGEAYIAMLRKLDDLGEELADVAIYTLGIAELSNLDLTNQIEKNKANKETIKNEFKSNLNIAFGTTYKKITEAYTSITDKSKLEEKLSEVIIHLSCIAEILDINLETEIEKKIDKNSKRVYMKDAKGVLIKEECLNGKI